MDLGISKRCAAVAASSKGLGFETARALAEEGVRVAICGRDAHRVEEARGEIGHSCVGFVCDVSHSDGARAFVQSARRPWDESISSSPIAAGRLPPQRKALK